MQPQKKRTTKQVTKRKQAQQSVRKQRGILVGILFVVVIAVSIAFVRVPFLRIRSIDVAGNQLIQSEDVMRVAWDTLQGSTKWGIPKGHIFLMNKQSLASVLTEQFPRIGTITIDRATIRSLVITIKEHPHAFMWCPTQTDRACYFADDTGLVFAKAPYFSGTVFMTFFGGDVVREEPIDSRILIDTNTFDTVVALVRVFDDAGFKIEGVTIGTHDEYTLHVQRIDAVRTPLADIIVTTQLPADMLIRNIRLAMDTEAFQKTFVASPATLDYIDARLAEKVFYKFQKPVAAPADAALTPSL